MTKGICIQIGWNALNKVTNCVYKGQRVTHSIQMLSSICWAIFVHSIVVALFSFGLRCFGFIWAVIPVRHICVPKTHTVRNSALNKDPIYVFDKILPKSKRQRSDVQWICGGNKKECAFLCLQLFVFALAIQVLLSKECIAVNWCQTTQRHYASFYPPCSCCSDCIIFMRGNYEHVQHICFMCTVTLKRLFFGASQTFFMFFVNPSPAMSIESLLGLMWQNGLFDEGQKQSQDV